MRKAELIMALAMAAFSLALMVKSAKLPVGWIPDEGPGGGAFPFWLALGMLVCCIVIITRWFARADAPAASADPYFRHENLWPFLMAAGSLTVMIGLIHVIGVYFSVPLFLLFYMRMLGGHRWKTSGALAVAAPVVTFLFFEVALTITLPKGYTEPLFYPLYDIFL